MTRRDARRVEGQTEIPTLQSITPNKQALNHHTMYSVKKNDINSETVHWDQ